MLCPHQFLEEAFRRGNITFGAEHELDCITLLIYGAVQVLEGSRSFWRVFTGLLLILGA